MPLRRISPSDLNAQTQLRSRWIVWANTAFDRDGAYSSIFRADARKLQPFALMPGFPPVRESAIPEGRRAEVRGLAVSRAGGFAWVVANTFAVPARRQLFVRGADGARQLIDEGDLGSVGDDTVSTRRQPFGSPSRVVRRWLVGDPSGPPADVHGTTVPVALATAASR